MPKRQKPIVYNTFCGRGFELDVFCSLHLEESVQASITLENKARGEFTYVTTDSEDLRKMAKFLNRMASLSERGHHRYWVQKMQELPFPYKDFGRWQFE